jgi:carbonic anhydrase
VSSSLDTSLDVLAEQALQQLVIGNKRFVQGEMSFPKVCKETLAGLAEEQHPYSAILCCSDSRVSPELIFDAKLGDLFVIRIAGNVMSPEVKGSLQYAGAHLRTPLFLVLGHQGCGAVKAALQYKRDSVNDGRHVQVLISSILAGLSEDTPRTQSEAERLAAAVEANVRWSMHQIIETPEWSNAVKHGAKVVGAVYQMTTGEVCFL